MNKIDMVPALVELRHEGEGNERYPLRLKYRLYKSWVGLEREAGTRSQKVFGLPPS